jgi:signal transduction histidine kinase
MNDMYEVYLGDTSDQLGYIYFSTPKYLPRIRYLVFLELAMAVLLVGFSRYGLFIVNRTEKDTLWIGLAKETAHQFGTPITSLMGWIDLLREAPEEGISGPELSKMVDYMTTDLNQLKNIASRFGKVGSQTKLVPTELHTVLQQTVSYFKERLPHLGSKMDIHLISKIQGIKVMLDTELFTWAMENLIKNCIDAMSYKGGNIFITATHNNKYVYIHIRDEGKGIPHSQWKKIFEPGITTKTRGWGLGLSLAKRIIEEYHQGVIKVLTSTINEGTTIEIRLNIAEQEEEKK